MLQLKSLALFCTLLAVVAYQAQVQAAKASNATTTTECPPENDNHNNGTIDDGSDDRLNDTLCDNFQALRATIEKNVLVDLIQTHYQCNSKFRKAMNYYNTARFRLVAEQLQQSDVYILLIEQLRIAGVDTSDIENIVDIFACIVLPVPIPDQSCDCKEVRGHTFVGDLLAALPYQAVHDYTSSARAHHTNFALFVDTISLPEFQARLRSNMMKRDVARPMRVLRRNGWDLPELLRAVMAILSW